MSEGDLSSNLYSFWKRLSSRRYSPSPMWGTYPAQEPMVQHARALFHAQETKDLQLLVTRKVEDLRHFDVAGMERAVAILMYGRSGSQLLASYLDGHDDVIMLPPSGDERPYQFFDRYRSLSLHDKLIAYPVFSTNFLKGDSPTAPAHYYAAVNALLNVYGNRSLEFLESRRAFFQFLHVAYRVALGRRPASPRPLIVWAQHFMNDQLARYLVEDFPQARFIHTVRDPITSFSRLFDRWFTGMDRGFLSAAYVTSHLTRADIAHLGMETRTRAIRFEDLHSSLEKTMRAVADWLGLTFQSSLLNSTLNGVPWTVQRGTISWSGVRPEQAIRDSRNISFTDRGLLFAVLNEDFVAWKYACPTIFRCALVRILTFMLVFLIPMKMEIIGAYTLIKTAPFLRRKAFRYAINGLIQIFICRVAIMSLMAVELFRRLIFGKKALQLL